MTHARSLRTLPSRLREERGNCFLYGCVTLVVLAMLGGLIAFLLTRKFIGEIREKYTETKPIALPTVDLPADKIQALIARVNEYSRDLRAGKPLPSLTLSETEVNALLQNHPDLKNVYGALLYLTFDDGRVTGQMSAPLDWMPGLGGRYFNGSATFDVTLSHHDVTVFLRSATVKGEAVPEQYLGPIRVKDFAADAKRKSDARSLLEKIDSVKIEKGSITITPSNKTGSPSGATPAPPPKDAAAGTKV